MIKALLCGKSATTVCFLEEESKKEEGVEAHLIVVISNDFTNTKLVKDLYFMLLFPFNITANTWFLFWIDSSIVQNSINRSS